jgi:uncharacterized protein (DUF2132 family)
MTTEQHRNNPLHGVGSKAMLEELVEHYGWDVLAEQLKINSFTKFPSIKSAHKFLHKTQWAREKTEAFYLYKFKQLPIPTDEEHVFPPRERSFDADLEPQLPAIITESDREFFDDPISGPKFRTPYDKSLSKDRSARRSKPYESSEHDQESTDNQSQKPSDSKKEESSASNESSTAKESGPPADSGSSDPWGKWRK